MKEPQFLRTIIVLPVSNIEESTKWYEHALGFKTQYLHEGIEEGEAANYAVLQRDGVQVHLILDEPEYNPPVWTKAGTGYLYLIVRNVDEVYEEIKSKEILITRSLQMENWGARGFNLTDPSGNEIHIEEGEE